MLKTFGDVKLGDKIHCFKDCVFSSKEVKTIVLVGTYVILAFSDDVNDTIDVRKTSTNEDSYYVCIEELIEDVKSCLADAVSLRDKDRSHA